MIVGTGEVVVGVLELQHPDNVVSWERPEQISNDPLGHVTRRKGIVPFVDSRSRHPGP